MQNSVMMEITDNDNYSLVPTTATFHEAIDYLDPFQFYGTHNAMLISFDKRQSFVEMVLVTATATDCR